MFLPVELHVTIWMNEFLKESTPHHIKLWEELDSIPEGRDKSIKVNYGAW